MGEIGSRTSVHPAKANRAGVAILIVMSAPGARSSARMPVVQSNDACFEP
jgi:hypothetical protein